MSQSPCVTTWRVILENHPMAHDSIKMLLDSLERESRRRLTHSELARALNVSEQVITNWAKRGMSTEGALAAQFAFGKDANYLLGRLPHPVMFPRGADYDASKPSPSNPSPADKRSRWPFSTISEDQWEKIDDETKKIVELLIQKLTAKQ